MAVKDIVILYENDTTYGDSENISSPYLVRFRKVVLSQYPEQPSYLQLFNYYFHDLVLTNPN